jgi:hypothetical protein
MTVGQVEDVPDWRLERFLLQELGPEEGEALRRQLGEAGLRERLSALETSNAEILAAHPPARVAVEVRARLGGGRAAPPRQRFRYTLALAASLAVVAGAAGWLASSRSPLPSGNETRVKGLAPQLLLFRKSGASGVERLTEGSPARDHDLVQVAYHAAGRRYGVVVSIDGRGVITRHLPTAGAEAAPLQNGPPVALAEAYELDDAPGFEQFYLVAADEPFAVAQVLEAVRRRHAGGAGGRLDLPPFMDQFGFELRKESAQ